MMNPAFGRPHKIHLTGAPQTLLITLYAKAQDSRSPRSILHDSKAAEMVEAIDYDFEGLKSPGGEIIVVRAAQIDQWIRDFVRTRPDAVVLNLGCGLDSRVERIAAGTGVEWFDVDYPQVIGLRENFFTERPGYSMIAASIMDPGWLAQVPRGRPVMIVAEGLLEYLPEEDVQVLLNRLTETFAHGRMAFDVMNSFAIRSGKAHLKKTTGAEHKWAVDDPAAVDRLNVRLRRLSNMPLFGSPWMGKLPWRPRVLFGLMNLVPPFRTMLRLLQYEF